MRRKLRYDLDLLGRRFGVSFEQVCHRLTTLNRPSDRGIPFFFIRIDPAGNVSKRLSVGKMQFARYGGTCAAGWSTRLSCSQQDFTQVAELRKASVSLPWHGRFRRNGHRRISLRQNLPWGWDAISNMRVRLSAGSHDLGKTARPVPIGIGCHVCERSDCGQRSQLPLGYACGMIRIGAAWPDGPLADYAPGTGLCHEGL